MIAFTFPPGVTIETFDGSNWPTWSSLMLSICKMNGYSHHITEDRPRSRSDDASWDDEEQVLLGVFELYIRRDTLLAVSDDTKFKTCKEKWVGLQRAYGRVGALFVFNTWVALTDTVLDDTSPMLPQLQRLNALRNTLASHDVAIDDLQFSFVLITALPSSYSSVATTILAGSAQNLSPHRIQDNIIYEEGRRARLSASLIKKKKRSNSRQSAGRV